MADVLRGYLERVLHAAAPDLGQQLRAVLVTGPPSSSIRFPVEADTVALLFPEGTPTILQRDERGDAIRTLFRDGREDRETWAALNVLGVVDSQIAEALSGHVVVTDRDHDDPRLDS